MRFRFGNKEVDLMLGKVYLRNTEPAEILEIRAKTLQVLEILVANRERVVTKQELLNCVWRDVVVQEQVLVQSIKEIRDLLGPDTIKTFPKLGYRWVIDIDVLSPPAHKSKVHLKWPVISFLVCLIIGCMVYVSINFSTSSRLPKVAFLPIENAMQDTLHDWVPIKGMDQLSQTLRLQSLLQVSEVDDVLLAVERLHRSNLTHEASGPQYFFKLQQALDVNLIVQTRLTGYPQDLQLHYTLHSHLGPQQGVVLAQNVADALTELSHLLAQKYGQTTQITATQYDSAFSNQAFAKGVNAYLQRDYQAAIALFRSALVEQPNMLAARRYLAASLANIYQLEQAIRLLRGSLQIEDSVQSKKEHLRANLMIGYLLINWPQASDRQAELLVAEEYIAKAKQLAQSSQDKLFIAYSYEELGKIKRLQGQFSEATRWLLAALDYHKSFHGRYGQTAALIELARIAIAQNELGEAKRYFAQAMEIANDSKARPNQIWVLLAQADMYRDLNEQSLADTFAKQALEIAHQGDSPQLIARVEAWFAQVPIHTVN
ncbi:winged helix-turn-helix domain-containing protein [Pseudoalteromonas sp. SMS1]|uniref:winged helix-turn-helix domain-containing protein n=1 Tax=Pseudoalteromonas sp. SMS1 TaxID=2908894 RepID=UPI001F1C82A3|nr:winged helix-turn-helix domain-containing protein [Pseudoalteromonas sp. SMS1]MCF2856375.1 winged helix-turn-helix domain-containing protein [Pseudoalteromonas sp. SMS1]